MFRKLKERLPKEKSKEELDEHYREMEKVGLEKSDLLAMLIAAIVTLFLPLLLIMAIIYGVLWLPFAFR